MGWRGINIDATPGSMKPFRECRPRDINIEAAVSNQNEKLRYFVFRDGALNTFDSELGEERKKNGWPLVQEVSLETVTLKSILEAQIPKETEIDFMSVDAEAFDLKVIQSNDWSKFRPKYILIEIFSENLEEGFKSPEAQYLMAQGYQVHSKLLYTWFFERKSF